jgi:ribosome-binding factor A
METGRREKRVANLIKEALSRLLIEEVQGTSSALITITRVEMSRDLLAAHVYLSLFGWENKEAVLELLEKRKGYFRKYIASTVNLKYNPQLIFSLDPLLDYEERIDRLIERAKKNTSET